MAEEGVEADDPFADESNRLAKIWEIHMRIPQHRQRGRIVDGWGTSMGVDGRSIRVGGAAAGEGRSSMVQ